MSEKRSRDCDQADWTMPQMLQLLTAKHVAEAPILPEQFWTCAMFDLLSESLIPGHSAQKAPKKAKTRKTTSTTSKTDTQPFIDDPRSFTLPDIQLTAGHSSGTSGDNDADIVITDADINDDVFSVIEANVVGFTQNYLEPVQSNTHSGHINVNLDTFMIYLPGDVNGDVDTCLELSFEYRAFLPGVSRPTLRFWAKSHSIRSRDAFLHHVKEFSTLLEDSHSTNTAILPYAHQRYSVQFISGFYTPIYTKHELTVGLERARDCYRAYQADQACHEGKVNYPWLTQWHLCQKPGLGLKCSRNSQLMADMIHRYDGLSGGQAKSKFCQKYSNISPDKVISITTSINTKSLGRIDWSLFNLNDSTSESECSSDCYDDSQDE